MKKRTILPLLLVAVLALGIGYAAVAGVTLQINGNAIVTPTQENFGVRFDGTPTVDKATAAILADKTKASLDVTGLSDKNDTATATFTVLNDGTVSQYAAEIKDLVIGTYNTTVFEITTDFAAKTLQPGDSMEITVIVKLIQVPTEEVSTPITITFKADPVVAA